MDFKEHVKHSQKFLSGTFHYSKDDPGENALRNVMEQSINILDKLDKFKKNKYYGKPLPPEMANEKVQMTVQGFERSDDNMEKLLHAVIGLSTECGELMAAAYKAKWGGEEFDVVNCKEEIGDLLWYMSILFRDFDLDLNEILQKNADKLDKRYGDKFSSEKAINRDLSAEREILEGA